MRFCGRQAKTAAEADIEREGIEALAGVSPQSGGPIVRVRIAVVVASGLHIKRKRRAVAQD